jgi:hypothetical protein
MNVTLNINPILKLNVIEVLLFPFGFFIVASCRQAVAPTKSYLQNWQDKNLGFHDIFSVKSLTFVLFHSVAMYYWHFIISYYDEQNFSVCYRTVLPLGNIGKYFAIVTQKVIFPISQKLTWENGNLVIRSRIRTVADVIKLFLT